MSMCSSINDTRLSILLDIHVDIVAGWETLLSITQNQAGEARGRYSNAHVQ